MSILYFGQAKDGELIRALERWLKIAKEGGDISVMAVADLGDDSVEVMHGKFSAVEVAGWAQYLAHRAFERDL